MNRKTILWKKVPRINQKFKFTNIYIFHFPIKDIHGLYFVHLSTITWGVQKVLKYSFYSISKKYQKSIYLFFISLIKSTTICWIIYSSPFLHLFFTSPIYKFLKIHAGDLSLVQVSKILSRLYVNSSHIIWGLNKVPKNKYIWYFVETPYMLEPIYIKIYLKDSYFKKVPFSFSNNNNEYFISDRFFSFITP